MFSSSNTQRAAFDRLADLATKHPKQDGGKDLGIDRLIKACNRPRAKPNGFLNDAGKAPSTSPDFSPITLRELDVLLALCKSAPSVDRRDHASKLVSQFTSSLEATENLLPPSTPLISTISPSPWEALSHNLTVALLSLGSRHQFLREDILRSTSTYIDNFLHASRELLSVLPEDEETEEPGDYEQMAELTSLALSLVGFLEGAATYAYFWEPAERLEVINQIRDLLSEPFLIAVETASSTFRNSQSSDRLLHDWRRYTKLYAAHGRTLGSMLLQQAFMSFVAACTSLTDDSGRTLPNETALDQYTNGVNVAKSGNGDAQLAVANCAAEIAEEMIQLVEDGSDYLQLGSASQQQLAFSAKASALMCLLNCTVTADDSVELDAFSSWLDDTLLDPDQMAFRKLATVALKAMTIVARMSPHASNLSHALLRFIINNDQNRPTVSLATRSLAQILHILSHDTLIGTLYSLGNLLSASHTTDTSRPHAATTANGDAHNETEEPHSSSRDSLILLATDGDEDTPVPYRNVIRAITIIANSCNDSKIVALVQSMLLQKITKINVVADACIIEEAASLALGGGQEEFQVLLKFFSRLYRDAVAQNSSLIVDAVQNARNYLASTLDRDSPLYRIYLLYLLESIVNKGGSTEQHKPHAHDAPLSSEEITPLLKPLAALMSKFPPLADVSDSTEEYGDVLLLLRDAWFNIAAHGISLPSEVGRRHRKELSVIAQHSPPLVSESQFDLLESDIELNTVLRRGLSSHHTEDKKKNLSRELAVPESDVRKLSYPKSVFLNAALLIECLRSSAGDCTKVFTYFLDPALNSLEVASCMKAIVEKVVGIYLDKALAAKSPNFSAPHIAIRLAEAFMASCHRIEKVQQVATTAASRIITQCPSALCDKRSLFALLDLLTLLWSSCLDEELDEFEWKSSFTSSRSGVKIELPDNYEFRQRTLNNLQNLARSWVSAVMNIAPLDVKGLLQTYLSEYDDDGAYGHISLGRSFALEMGSTIPSSDQRLGSIDNHGNTLINVASDFIAQYTTRQEYRYSEKPAVTDREEWPLTTSKSKVSPLYADAVREMEFSLAGLEIRISREKQIPADIPRNVLRRAAALLCGSKEVQPSIISHLVNIPFQMFTNESINLGTSLWLGVIHENAKTEPRMLVEVAQAWERTISRKSGIFNPSFKWVDPFMSKTESLPSDKDAISKRQRKARSVIYPHLRVLQFLESHFSATRHRSIHIQRVFQRLIRATLTALTESGGHPLAREVHFHVILFGLKVLRYSTGQSKVALWKLKDQILSAALAWFRHPLKWSFGGNRLQIKAEEKIMADIEGMLKTTSSIGTSAPGSRKSLEPKQELLSILLENERSRLKVWLSPLDVEKRHYLSSGSGSRGPSEATAAGLLRLAWSESPGLAMQLATRFPSSKLQNDVRWLLLNFPDKAMNEPDAIEVLLGVSLPQDISFQLKYLIYWAPVNPIAAVTYFLPAYGNHPFVLQFAMRSLESHAVDVSFFYIPQLVQALRYDALGYVEQFLLETAQLSSSFAHQVIWNMKANAYKDEDSQVPDPLKPDLDRFIDTLIGSFTDDDRAFYEKEFSFFNEVTGVSGKLRPYIKRSKPEKKEKIEEELRKIKVEVGVYLPSNPDGVVVGIDRQSGKPLQSHAKAPYMATFRIQKTKRKEENGNGNGNGAISAAPNKNDPPGESSQQANQLDVRPAEEETTYNVWQSAIFKVGDDCRQDVLALQMIAAFRSIFASIGLDVFVHPYRVVATAPGCGVIDVLPNSISRDMLGREAVNGLYDYFVSKYGGEQSTHFQEARSNFIKSMAAYSVISYLLQFKDRHNGNIMIDDAGHIIHIDFGFCFDIAPGGVRFERAPFKLTSEMIAVMGGLNPPQHSTPTNNPTDSQSYRWFESLTVKAFLASRPYATKLSHVLMLMLDSGLPCFKPETMKNFRDRFVLDKTEQEAAQFMRDLVRKSYANMSTKGYDQFQLMTNNIPY